MANLPQPGEYDAVIVGSGFKKADSGAWCFKVLCETAPEERVYVDSWLIKKDGQLNVKAVEMLMEHIPWDGKSFEELERLDLTGEAVRIYVTTEMYNGEPKIKAGFSNDRRGYVDSGEVSNLDKLMGHQLRALNGGSRLPSNPNPTSPPPKAEPQQFEPSTYQDCWEYYLKLAPEAESPADEERNEKGFWRAYETILQRPASTYEQATPEDWGRLKAGMEANDDIPF